MNGPGSRAAAGNGAKPRGFLNEAVWPNLITVRQDPISEVYAVETRPFARGKFATVRRCRHIESGRDYAAKYLRKRRRAEDVRHELIHEALVLAVAHRCDRIVSLYEAFETPSEIILVLEMATGGELQHVVDAEDSLPEDSVRRLLLQIAEGLAFLHSHHIAHLDIKPANLLLASNWPLIDAKLCDFGISRLILPGEEIFEIAGTPDYVAPEVLQYEPISLATDIWSVGILTYVLLTGHTPFGGDTKQETYCNITLGQLDFPSELFKDVSEEAVHFITQLVVKDPRKRLTIAEVLKHPWLTQALPSPGRPPSILNGCPPRPTLGRAGSDLAASAADGVAPELDAYSDASSGRDDSSSGNRRSVSSDSVDGGRTLPLSHRPTRSPPLHPVTTAASAAAGRCHVKSSASMDGGGSGAERASDGGASSSAAPAPPEAAAAAASTSASVSSLLSRCDTGGGQQIIEIEGSSCEERISVADSASPAPEEELPSLQSFTSSSSSDSPVPCKKEKDSHNRHVAEIKSTTRRHRTSAVQPESHMLTAKPPTAGRRSAPASELTTSSTSSFAHPASPILGRAVDHPRCGAAPSSPLSALSSSSCARWPLRSTSVSPVRTMVTNRRSYTSHKHQQQQQHHQQQQQASLVSVPCAPLSMQALPIVVDQSEPAAWSARRAGGGNQGVTNHVHPITGALSAPTNTSSSTLAASLLRPTSTTSLKRSQPPPASKHSRSAGAAVAATAASSTSVDLDAAGVLASAAAAAVTAGGNGTAAPASVGREIAVGGSLRVKGANATRPSLLLSPTVSSALKSCSAASAVATPLRSVNNSLLRATAAAANEPAYISSSIGGGGSGGGGSTAHRRSLLLAGVSLSEQLQSAQENKTAGQAGASIGGKKATATERSVRRGSSKVGYGTQSSPSSSAITRRSSLLLEARPKPVQSRKSMDIDSLGRKTFADDMVVY